MDCTRPALSNAMGRSRTWALAGAATTRSTSVASSAKWERRPAGPSREIVIGIVEETSASGPTAIASGAPAWARTGALLEPLDVASPRVREAQSLVEQRRVGAVERGGHHKPVGSPRARPSLRRRDEHPADAASAHLGRHDERRELRD